MDGAKAASSIVVLDPGAGPADPKSKQRLQALIKLIIANDHELPVFHDLEERELSSLGKESKLDDKAENELGEQDDKDFASSFQVSVTSQSPALDVDDKGTAAAGQTHSRIPWHISNRYYDADVEFVSISLPLTRKSIPRPPSGVDSRPVDGRADQIDSALRTALEGVPALILVLSEPYSEQVHRRLLERISTIQDVFDLEVSLAINVGAPLSAEVSASSTPRPLPGASEDLSELYAEQGWEYIDLMAIEEEAHDEDDDDEDGQGRLQSVQAGEAEVTGIDRVRQALFANTWPNLRRNDERRRNDAGIDPSRQRLAQDQDGTKAQHQPFVGFSDSQQVSHNQDDDGLADEASGQAYVERLHERVQEATRDGTNHGYGQMESTDRGNDQDNFGDFQEAGPSTSSNAVSSHSLEAWLNDNDDGKNKNENKNKNKNTTSFHAATSEDDFAARFGPVPDEHAFFASDEPASSSAFQQRADHDDNEPWDEEDQAILTALTPSQAEVDQLRSQLSQSHLTPAAPPGDEAGRQADDDGSEGEAGGARIEALFSQMSSLKSAMDVHAARIQAIQDPVLKRKEAVKVSLAYTQMLMGAEHTAPGIKGTEERDSGTASDTLLDLHISARAEKTPPSQQKNSQQIPFIRKHNARDVPPSTMASNICKFFLQGSCRFGNDCRNSHNPAAAAPAFGQAPSSTAQPNAAFGNMSRSFGGVSVSGAGSSTNTVSAFGQPSAFGAGATSGGGNSAFGQPSAFGASAGAGAGAGGGAPAFGRPSAFGAAAPSTPFGQTSGSTAFGQPSAFGAAAAPSAFGQPSGLGAAGGGGAGSAFGRSSAFGSSAGVGSTSAFGQPSALGAGTASAFGRPSAFGAAAGTGTASAFGTAAGTGTASAFGVAAGTTSAFGQAASGAGGSTPAFGQPSAFGGTPSQTVSAFGASTSTPSAFGSANAPSAFGTGSSAPSAFGSSAPTTNAMSAFGSSSGPVSAFGRPSAFGATSAAPVSAFGQKPTGAQATVSAFGAPASTTSAFGATASAQPAFGSASAFGAPASVSAFGAPSASAFGSAVPTTTAAPATSAFGFASTQPSTFGTTSSSATGTSVFGAPAPAAARSIPVERDPYASLLPSDSVPALAMQVFQADSFEWDRIPGCAPPVEVR
ncbi:unnamed protein product [Tilletia controversa]|nr:unnamed protein product [Tilletia controversa]